MEYEAVYKFCSLSHSLHRMTACGGSCVHLHYLSSKLQNRYQWYLILGAYTTSHYAVFFILV